MKDKIIAICIQLMTNYPFLTQEYRIAESIHSEITTGNLHFLCKQHEANYYFSRVQMLKTLVNTEKAA